MTRIDLPYLHVFRDRHGHLRHYYRRGGRRVALPGAPGSEAFMAAYWAERKRDEVAVAKPSEPARSFNNLARIYITSPAYRDLKASTKAAYSRAITRFLGQYGELPVDRVKHDHISKIVGDMADTPGAANVLLKRLRQLFALAIRLDWIERDPSAGIKAYRLGEIETWSDADVEKFMARWPSGTRQRLALLMHLYTGQRNSDIVRLTWPVNGLISVRQVKTSARLQIPVDPALEEEMRRHPRPHAVILTTARGEPFSVAGYGNWMRAAIRAAGLPDGRTAHGLRKTAARHLAEAGCSTREIMAITGHKTLSEVERYTREASQPGLARAALARRRGNR